MTDPIVGALLGLIATTASKTVVGYFSARRVTSQLHKIHEALAPVVARLEKTEARTEAHETRLKTLEHAVARVAR